MPTMPFSTTQLEPLLDHLAPQLATVADHDWHGWRVRRINGGMNNIVLRATNDDADFAIKFTRRDARNRARREFDALRLLHTLPMPLAPAPVHFDDARYAQPVVVQTWLAGEVRAEPPRTRDEWQKLIDHLVSIHEVALEHAARFAIALVNANLSPSSPRALAELAREVTDAMPDNARSAAMRDVLRLLGRSKLSDAAGPARLIRCDANTLNFIRRDDGWRSVDWENSGWGDPAFEMGEMMTHPKYLDVDEATWHWFIEAYCAATGETVTRIRAYRAAMLAWWAATCERNLWLNDADAHGRLVQRPADWREHVRRLHEHYCAAAIAVLNNDLGR